MNRVQVRCVAVIQKPESWQVQHHTLRKRAFHPRPLLQGGGDGREKSHTFFCAGAIIANYFLNFLFYSNLQQGEKAHIKFIGHGLFVWAFSLYRYSGFALPWNALCCLCPWWLGNDSSKTFAFGML